MPIFDDLKCINCMPWCMEYGWPNFFLTMAEHYKENSNPGSDCGQQKKNAGEMLFLLQFIL